MGSLIVILVALFIFVGIPSFAVYQFRKQHRLRKLQIRDLEARERERREGRGAA
jgi:hypothetical protein